MVRLHGTGKHKPVLLIGHLDVVEANREDWTADPFKFTEKDGYFYGRGTSDMKGDDAIMVASLLRMKRKATSPTATSSWRSRRTRKAAAAMAPTGCSRTTAT